MPTTTDLIGLAIDAKPVDFADALNDILQQKAVDALEAHKVELATSIYGDAEDDFDVDADEGEVEYDEEGDEDLEDLDLDLDLDDLDLDLEDLDLEDITDE